MSNKSAPAALCHRSRTQGQPSCWSHPLLRTCTLALIARMQDLRGICHNLQDAWCKSRALQQTAASTTHLPAVQEQNTTCLSCCHTSLSTAMHECCSCIRPALSTQLPKPLPTIKCCHKMTLPSHHPCHKSPAHNTQSTQLRQVTKTTAFPHSSARRIPLFIVLVTHLLS
jgi:hypothetical protein